MPTSAQTPGRPPESTDEFPRVDSQPKTHRTRWLLVGTVGTAVVTIAAVVGVVQLVGDRHQPDAGAPTPLTRSASATSTVAPSAHTNCLAKPSSCGYPDAASTGAHGSLKRAAAISSTTDGQVIKNVEIHGYIKVTSANVTIENVRIIGGAPLGAIDLHLATGHTTITDVTIVASSDQLAGMTLRNATVTRADISGSQDGIDSWGGPGPTIVQDSYIHDLNRKRAIDSHDDTLQISGGDQTFKHNTLLPFDGTDPMNSCLQVGDLQGDLIQLTFADNLCDGGNYSLNANSNNVDRGKVTAGPLTFTGNRFGRDYRYGVKIHLGKPFHVTWSNNVDDLTNKPV